MQKSLTMPNGESKAVNRRSTAYIMAKRKKDKSRSNDLQSTTQNIKDRATRTPLKTRG